MPRVTLSRTRLIRVPTKPRILALGVLAAALIQVADVSSAAGLDTPAETSVLQPNAPSTSDSERDIPPRTPISRLARDGKRPGGILGAEGSGSAGWWFGGAGIAAVLAVCGGLCIAARKFLPPSSSSLLQVVGRVSLSPKHSVYLLRVDGRVLLIGAGPQGAPSYLGELADSSLGAEEHKETFPPRPPITVSRIPERQGRNQATRSEAVTRMAHPEALRNTHLDIRLGDEE